MNCLAISVPNGVNDCNIVLYACDPFSQTVGLFKIEESLAGGVFVCKDTMSRE
jgi:hypothetical protein